MKDPLGTPPEWLSQAITPLSRALNFSTLPLHIHEVLLSFIAYTIINIWLSPLISTYLFPAQYPALSKDRKANWDVHVVSLCQSTMINILALWVMWTDEERYGMEWEERIWGYTGGAGMIQGFAAGYFLWDLCITLQNVRLFGWGMLAHAVCALFVFSFGFRPFVNFYGCTFILYELSSPFLNFHWFFDKLGMTGSNAQLYNGIVLLIVFFSCRLVWGTYQSLRVYQDIWRALHHTPLAASPHLNSLNSTASAVLDAAKGNSAAPINGSEVMRFAGEEYVPLWLALSYLASNITLNCLNFYWFGKMIDTIRKRFQTPVVEKKEVEGKPVKTTGVNGSTVISADQTEVRKRNLPRLDSQTVPPGI